ncbi:hypothetical protein BJX76DRAFT_345521 [Aspergillus varians]
MVAEVGTVDSILELIASANLTLTEHSRIKAFVNEAVDSEYAARYVSQRIKDHQDHAIEDRNAVPLGVEDLVRYRDGPYCCFSSSKDASASKGLIRAEAAWTIPPRIFDDGQMAPEGSLFALWSAFLTPAKMLQLQDTLCYRDDETYALRNIWLLSPSIHSAFRNGHVKIIPFTSDGQWTDEAEDRQEDTKAAYFACGAWLEGCTDLYLNDGSPFSEPGDSFTIHSDDPTTYYLLSNVLLRIHYRAASALHILAIEDRIAAGWPALRYLLRRFWHFVPKFFRIWSYRTMSQLARYLYSSNDRVIARRLPFGLYLKTCARSQRNEATALRLVEQHTSIPAPLWVDDYEENGYTTLIMTRIEGQTLYDIFYRLSYPEREQLAQDLKQAVHQLRGIPNKTRYRFCNAMGGALVDHRAGTCGPFTRESDFNQHLTSKSFFTHSDLHNTNILMSQGRLAGIYWEYTRAIYGAINNDGWEKVIRNAFDEDYEDELRVEKLPNYLTHQPNPNRLRDGRNELDVSHL